MSPGRILALGAIAGFTIFLGLPIGRVRRPALKLRALLNAIAIGILAFLLFDVLAHATEPVEAALTAAAIDHNGSWWRCAGLAAGLLGLVYYDRWTRWTDRRPRPRLRPRLRTRLRPRRRSRLQP